MIAETEPKLKRRWIFRRKFRARLFLVALGSLLGLLLLEGTLRIAGIGAPPPYVPDRHCAARLYPGFRGRQSKEGRSTVYINEHGFHDREREKEKPAGTLRIAVLGDSYAEALQVPIEKTFWSVLESQLNDCIDDRNVEVLNFGISGYGTASEYEMLRHYVWEFEPDVILLAVCTGNDIRNNSKALETERVRPFYDIDDQGELQLDNSFREHPIFRKEHTAWARTKTALVTRSRVLQKLNEAWQNRNRLPQRTGLEPGLDDQIYVPPSDADWLEAWELTERLIVAMREECQRHDAALHVVTLTNGIQVYPDAEVREDFMQRLNVPDLFYPERRFRALCEREQIPIVTLAEPMQQYADSDGVYFHGFENTKLGWGHWNETGHRIAGELIADALCEEFTAE